MQREYNGVCIGMLVIGGLYKQRVGQCGVSGDEKFTCVLRRVARQWTREHGVHRRGKVFLRQSTHTELVHCTQSPTHLYACVHVVFGVVHK